MKIDSRQKLLTVVAMVAVVALAADRLVLTPSINLWRDHAHRISELRTNLDKGKALLAREQAIRDRWDKLQKSALPNDGSAAESKVLTAVE